MSLARSIFNGIDSSTSSSRACSLSGEFNRAARAADPAGPAAFTSNPASTSRRTWACLRLYFCPVFARPWRSASHSGSSSGGSASPACEADQAIRLSLVLKRIEREASP